MEGNLHLEAATYPDRQRDYDLIVIGSGPAGEKAAIQAAKLGKRVAVVEKHPNLGGACIHTATLPSKALREAVLFVSGLKQRSLYGITVSLKKNLSPQDLLYRKMVVAQNQSETVHRKFDRNSVDVIQGEASFVDPYRLRVRSADGAVREYSAHAFVIAVGSRPARPSSLPFDDHHIYDTDSIFNLDRIPRTLAIAGAGVVGCEYASIFAALGVKGILLDSRTDVLDFLDREIAQMLLYRMRMSGVTLRLGEEVEGVEIDGPDRVVARCASGKMVVAERLLFAGGRIGNTDRLELEQVGLTPGRRGLLNVNEHFQTEVPHIYAVGDVIGFPSLAATSMNQGRLAVLHAFANGNGKPFSISDYPMPYGIYTIPEVSTVGATEEELTRERVPYEMGHAFFREIARGDIVGDVEGMLKLLFHRDTLRLLGVHIIGEKASELIHTGQAVIAHGGTIEYFIDNVFNYPTLSEAYKVAALNGMNRL